jgi:hypothetical protein
MKPNSQLIQATPEKLEEFEKTGQSYRGIVGALNYLSTTTRPNITFAVSCLSQFLNNPGTSHWHAAVHTLQYLKGSKDFSINIKKSQKGQLDFVSYVDASWANFQMTGRSTTGYLVQWNGNLVSWRSKKQSSESLSSTEAKYVAMSDLVKELLWLRMVVSTFLSLEIPAKIPIYEDNQAAI